MIEAPTRLGDDVRCDSCDRPALVWCAKPATQAHLALIVECKACGRGYPTRYINRRKDTRDEALAEQAREVVA